MLHAPPEMRTENWKPIPGYEGSYEVSDLGRVRSLARRVRLVAHGIEMTRSVPPRILRPGKQSASGHLSVALGKGNSQSVHVLVLLAFVGSAPEGCECLHIDGNATNNTLENLRWGTRRDNLIDIFYHKGRSLNREQVLYLRRRAAEGFYHGERYHLARRWGVNSGTIYNVLSGRQYFHVL
jgi:hypothetical protein